MGGKGNEEGGGTAFEEGREQSELMFLTLFAVFFFCVWLDYLERSGLSGSSDGGRQDSFVWRWVQLRTPSGCWSPAHGNGSCFCLLLLLNWLLCFVSCSFCT